MSTRLIRFIRTAPARRLVAVSIIVVAIGARSSRSHPQAIRAGSRPGDARRAIHNALTQPAVAGLSADVKFTNHLIDSSAIQGADPLLTGGTGRVWVGADGRFRLELHGDNGDPQITSDGTNVTIYDAQPTPRTAGRCRRRRTPPTVGRCAGEAADAGRHPDRARQDHAERQPVPGDADRHRRTSGLHRPRDPKHDAGLLGAAEIAWDSDHGVPLRVAVYAADNPSPVLELSLSGVSYGAIPDSTFDVAPPAGTKVVDFNPPGKGDAAARRRSQAGTGVDAVARLFRSRSRRPTRSPACRATRYGFWTGRAARPRSSSTA